MQTFQAFDNNNNKKSSRITQKKCRVNAWRITNERCRENKRKIIISLNYTNFFLLKFLSHTILSSIFIVPFYRFLLAIVRICSGVFRIPFVMNRARENENEVNECIFHHLIIFVVVRVFVASIYLVQSPQDLCLWTPFNCYDKLIVSRINCFFSSSVGRLPLSKSSFAHRIRFDTNADSSFALNKQIAMQLNTTSRVRMQIIISRLFFVLLVPQFPFFFHSFFSCSALKMCFNFVYAATVIIADNKTIHSASEFQRWRANNNILNQIPLENNYLNRQRVVLCRIKLRAFCMTMRRVQCGSVYFKLQLCNFLTFSSASGKHIFLR